MLANQSRHGSFRAKGINSQIRKVGSINYGNDGHAGYKVWERTKSKKLLDCRSIEACGTWVRRDLININEYKGMSVCTMDSLGKGFGHLNLVTFRYLMPTQNGISAHYPGPVVMWFLFIIKIVGFG